MKYRKSDMIVSEILQCTQESGQEGIKTTILMQQANLPHNRLGKFLDKLTKNDMINRIEYDGKHTFVITQKGRMYLEQYAKFTEVTKAFGLDM